MNNPIKPDSPDGALVLPPIVRPSSEYRYLGDFAACEIWAARHMACDTCRVSWTGCWDNFMCPECGEGDLPGCEPTGMTLREMYEESMSQPNVEAIGRALARSMCRLVRRCLMFFANGLRGLGF